MVAVFHSVLGCRTERRVFGNEALKNRWLGELFPWHICSRVVLGFWGGAAHCLHVCWAQSAATHLRSHGGFHWIVRVCLALRQAHVVCAAVGKIARLKEILKNKASVLIDQPIRFIFKSGLFTTNFYCFIDTTESRFRELKLLFSQP